MKREFLEPQAPFHCGIMYRNKGEQKPTFHQGVVYRDKGETEWKPLDTMPESEQAYVVCRLNDDFIGKRFVLDAVHKGAKTNLEILKVVVPRLWGKLTASFDIDDNNLNFEISYGAKAL